MKSHTNLPQSKKLAEFLPLESADMWFANGIYLMKTSEEPKDIKGFFPCWSLAALMELTTKVQQDGIFFSLTYDFILNKWTMNIEADNWRNDVGLYDNPIDACYEMILELHRQRLL